MWLSHPSFLDQVKSAWSVPIKDNPQFILFQKLKALRQGLRMWKKEVFGNLQQNIKLAEDKFLCLQTAMDTSSADFILDYLTLAKAEMQNLLQAEELHWKQKSRIKWLTEGNRNTRFFHLSTKIKGNLNTIDRITVRNTAISEFKLIKSAAIQHSTTTFETQPVQVHDSLFNCDHKRVSSDQNIPLTVFRVQMRSCKPCLRLEISTPRELMVSLGVSTLLVGTL